MITKRGYYNKYDDEGKKHPVVCIYINTNDICTRYPSPPEMWSRNFKPNTVVYDSRRYLKEFKEYLNSLGFKTILGNTRIIVLLETEKDMDMWYDRRIAIRRAYDKIKKQFMKVSDEKIR